MRDIDKVFSERLRALRLERQLTQEELAHRAGVHEKFVGQIERRERNVSLRMAGRLAVALKVPLSTLTGEADETAPTSPTLARIARLLDERPEEDLALLERLLSAAFGPWRPSRGPRLSRRKP